MSDRRYIPAELTGTTVEELRYQFTQELVKISQAFNLIADGGHDVLHEEPAKPEEGMIVVADGTDWNPGFGAGQYTYIGGTWVAAF